MTWITYGRLERKVSERHGKYSDSVSPGPDLKQYDMFGPSSDFLRLYARLATLNNGNCFLVVRS